MDIFPVKCLQAFNDPKILKQWPLVKKLTDSKINGHVFGQMFTSV